MKVRKKPVIIEAVQWNKMGDHPAVLEVEKGPYISIPETCSKCGKPMKEHGFIDTLEDGHIVCPTDWIMTGVKGENYPIKDDIFRETYEEAHDDN